ncbi:MAG: hypothetical protein DBX44_00145 [Oscillospiraceae bacterium]|nr:MAG: hypothetical protein DBX44_00145 [Oscillospiraceae bacterium]
MQRNWVRRVKYVGFCTFVAVCGAGGSAAVGAVLLFLLMGALPALQSQGLLQMLGEIGWEPQAGRYGLAAMILATAISSFGAASLATPVALAAAAFARNLLPPAVRRLFRALLELLSGLPSVMFGLLGLLLLLPALVQIFPGPMATSGGATLLAAMLVLAALLLPSSTLSLLGQLDSAGKQVDRPSRALGASPMQTVFRLQIPTARDGIMGVWVSGMRRAAAEGIAVLLVSGNVARLPSLFSGVRTLASGMLLEMGYASGIHRAALFTMALLLLIVSLLTGLSFRWHGRCG